MSTYPHPLAFATKHDPPKVPGAYKWHKDAELIAEMKEQAEKLSKLRESVESVLDHTKKGYVSLRAKTLADARAGLLKGEELRSATNRLLKTHAFLDKFEKHMKLWTYGDLVIAVLTAKPGEDRNQALEKLGFTFAKDVTPPLVRFAKEVAHISEKVTAKQFLEKILGKGAVLAIEGADLPLTIAIDILTPTELGKDDVLLGPDGYYAKQQQAKCRALINKGASSDKVHECMADLLAIQRGENPRKPRVIAKKPLTITVHPQPRPTS